MRSAKINVSSAFYIAFILLASIGITLQNILLGENNFWGEIPSTFYNNFIIFRQSFPHLLHKTNLYQAYPHEYGDLYKYSPTFAFCMAPFSILPDWLGLFLWNIINIAIIVWVMHRLIHEKRTLFFLFLFIVPELILSVQNSQSNALLAGMVILAFDALERGKNGLAALLIALTVYIKLFTLVVFILFLFYPNRIKSSLYAVMWMLVLLVLPLVVTGPHDLMQQYLNWAELIRNDHSISFGSGLPGFLHTLGLFAVHKNALLAFGVILLLLPLLRYKDFHTTIYRQNYLCLLLAWMVIFNHKAESPSYIIAFVGYALWAYFNGLSKPSIILLVLCFLFSSVICMDVVPHDIRVNYFEAYTIKALFPSIILFVIVAGFFRKPQPALQS